MIKRIFLDLDDVLNTFTIHALQHVGCEIRDYEDYKPEWGYDIVHAANVLLGNRVHCPKSFWAAITREVWSNCPPSMECGWLIHKAAEAVGRENVTILSRPTYCPESLAGKLEWIHKYIPHWLHRQYMLGINKSLLADSESLLIDDNQANVNEFRDKGFGWLMPRPWNLSRGRYSFDSLSTLFNEATFRYKVNANV